MNSLLLGTLIGLILLYIISSRRRSVSKSGDSPPIHYVPEKSASEILQELKAREILERDYKYVVPNYGLLYGKKILKNKVTPELLLNSHFIASYNQGKWVKKSANRRHTTK